MAGAGYCPTACNANSCTKEDDTEGGVPGFYMCVKQGQGDRKRVMCVGAEETAKKQKQGRATCGCDGCPTGCPTGCSGAGQCTVELEDGSTDTGGKMMCMKQQQGNRQKTMCVASADVEKKEMQGRLTCGCCEDSLTGACILPREDGETSEDGVDTSEDGEDDEEDDEATSVDGAII